MFGQGKIEYLGHAISGEGVAADQTKIHTMLHWPTPKTLRELRGFLMLTGYYRRFVSGYAKIAWPLTDLLKKDGFSWSVQAEAAFQALKVAMTEVPVLALPDFTQTFVVETDASGHGLGAVLMQNQHPLAYFSQVLPQNARHKSVYEQELMAIVFVIQKWRHYLLGRHFIVRTHQRSLKFLLEQRMVSNEHQKWLTKLLGYDFEIQYRPGLENKAADALSRIEPALSLLNITVPRVIHMDEIKKEVVDDEELGKMVNGLQSGQTMKEGSSLLDG